MIESFDKGLSPLDIAFMLSERNEVYLALEVLVESIKLSRHASSRDRDQWSLFAELINKVTVLQAAERAYELTSFLDRFGIQLDDESSFSYDLRGYSRSESEVDAVQEQTNNKEEEDARTDESVISSGSTVFSQSFANKYLSGVWKIFKIFISKTSHRSIGGMGATRSISLRRRAPHITQTRFRDIASSHRTMTGSFQEVSQSARDHALWAISECEILGCSRMSEASTTSFEATDNHRVENIAFRKSSQLGIIRFFRSFVLSKSKCSA